MKTLSIKKFGFLFNKNAFAFIMSLLFHVNYGICQKSCRPYNESIGFNASVMISVDGYGMQYSPTLYYKRDRQLFDVGLLIQSQKHNLSGVQFGYNYTLVGGDAPSDMLTSKRLELFCFISSAYEHRALLGRAIINDEKTANKNLEGVDLCRLTYRSVEIYVGFGFKIKLLKNIKWVNSIGIGAYDSFGGHRLWCREQSACGLDLKTGISIEFGK